MTKAKTTTPDPDPEAERLAAEAAAQAEADRLAVEEAAKNDATTQADPAAIAAINAANAVQADTGATPEAAPPEKLFELIAEIEAHLFPDAMPHTIAALTEREGLRVVEDPESPQITVTMAGVEATAATASLVAAMAVWCNAARRHMAEAA